MQIKINKKKIPQDWQIKKVKDVFDFIGTYSHSKDKMLYEIPSNNVVFNIHYGDIHTKYSTYIDFSKTKIPFLKDFNEKINKEKFLRNGDLVIADASEDYLGVCDSVELINLENKKCISGLHTFALRDKGKNTSNGYRALLFKNPRVHNWLMRVSTYSKVYGVTKSSLEKTDLFLPPLPEQDRIVAVLETWDKAIEKLQQKIKVKKEIKKGLMQDLLTGNKRLKGFSGEWKEYKLEDIAEFKKGSGISKNQIVDGGGNPCLLYGEIYTKYDELILNIQSYTNSKEGVWSEKGDVFVPASTTTNALDLATATTIIEDKILVGGDVNIIRNKKNLYDPIFLSYYLSHTIKRKIAKYSQGVTIIHLYGNHFKKEKITIPSLKEQGAIASVIKSSTKEILLIERKLKYLQKQKKYLLNNLITGQIRTPENLLEKVK